jgi:glutamate dehydrogenase/leucine dehydrogenase
MALQKLENADAFVVRDLDTEAPAIGIVRSAPKILQGGAQELARSQTYQLAALEMRYQGASCGVNAAPDARDDAMMAFCAELMPAVESSSLMLNNAKGVSPEQIAPLTAADRRNDLRFQDIDGISNTAHLTGIGAVACASSVRSLDGANVAIENFDDVGLAVARAAVAAGAKITAISTSVGAAISAGGFDLGALATTWKIDGPGMVATLSKEELPFWRILGADVDVLFAGSKAGLIDHKNGENITASVLVPTGPIPYTTKGALTIERQGVTVLPDFITTAGGLLAGFPEGDDQAAIESWISSKLQSLMASILGKDASPILEACFQAETFLKTWRDDLPFGRPFA